MIAHECQLRYVIRDKIQSEKKIFLSEETFFVKKLFIGKKLSRILSQNDGNQSELSRTNQCLSLLSGK